MLQRSKIMKTDKVTYYKNIDLLQNDLTIPEKLKGKYFSYLSNQHKPLFIQTPTVHVFPLDKNTIRIRVKKDGHFEQLLKSFDEHVIDFISQKSTQFFRGFLFTKNKITSSFIPTLDSEGYFDVHVANADKLLIKDQRQCIRKYDEILPGTEAIAILNIEGVAFTKKTIKLSLALNQLKMYVEEELNDWYISQDDSDIDEDPVEAEELAHALHAAHESSYINNEKEFQGNSSCTDHINAIDTPNEHDCENIADTLHTESSIPVGDIDISLQNDDDKDLF